LEILKILKERHKRTIERKLQNGDDLIFDEKRGIINEDTDQVVLDIKYIYSTGTEGDTGIAEEEKNDDVSSDEDAEEDEEFEDL
jgi:hypothetical protein